MTYQEDKTNNIEIQYDGSFEKSYRLDHPEGIKLKTHLLSLYPEIRDFSGVEMISYHQKDSVAYIDDCIVCVYKKIPDLKILEEFKADIEGDYQDYYTIKYPLFKNYAPYLKVYSNELQFHPVPSLPAGSCMCSNVTGIGLHHGCNELLNLRDFYFSHNNRELMISTYGDLYPYVEEDFKVNTRAYGIIYDVSTLKVLKVKRYIFPYDEGLFNLRDK
jgi:hypothetical protein